MGRAVFVKPLNSYGYIFQGFPAIRIVSFRNIKTNPERAYGKAQSRGGDANTVLEVVSGVLLYGMSVSLEQSVFTQEGK